MRVTRTLAGAVVAGVLALAATGCGKAETTTSAGGPAGTPAGRPAGSQLGGPGSSTPGSTASETSDPGATAPSASMPGGGAPAAEGLATPDGLAALVDGMATARFRGTFAMALHMNGGTGSARLDAGLDVTGEYDRPNERWHVVETVTDYREEPASTASVSQVGDTTEGVADHGRLVTKDVEGGKPKLADGKPWRDRTRQASTPVDPFQGAWDPAGVDGTSGMVNPLALLAQLGHASAVADVGAEQVDGVDTRHLHATIPVRALLGTDGDAGGQATCTRDEVGDAALEADVFVDAQQTLRRATFTGDVGPIYDATYSCLMPGRDLAGTSAFTYRTTLDFLDVGQPVTITMPAESEIGQASKFEPVGSAIS